MGQLLLHRRLRVGQKKLTLLLYFGPLFGCELVDRRNVLPIPPCLLTLIVDDFVAFHLYCALLHPGGGGGVLLCPLCPPLGVG